jgi:uncharacterized repeat protein (TIGR01451 family)
MKTKTTKLLIAAALALLVLGGVTWALAWRQPARAEVNSPSAPQTLPGPYLNYTDTVDAPYDSFSPAIDGAIAPGEYAGAGKVTFPGYGGDVEVFFKEDNSYLYVTFDFPAPQTSGSAAQVFLDTKHNGGTAPQPDDYRFSITRSGSAMENSGTGTGWGSPTVPVSWTVATTTTLSGWQAEFRIQYDKLGLTPGTFKVMGLSMINAWTPGGDYYWPRGAFWTNPSRWGHLTSSSDWGTLYWKPGPWEDYAPSGMPDFDQKQDNWFVAGPLGPAWTHCGPVAMANSLWWFDSKFETLTGTMPPVISDTYPLVWSYADWDDHHHQNVIPLVDDLANNYFGTNATVPFGTSVYDMYTGMQRYLRDHNLWDDYVVTLVRAPTFEWVADEVMRSEDVVLLLGFYELQGDWVRVGGHYVSVAGVDPAGAIAFSDPFLDASESGLAAGRVLSGTMLLPHKPGHSPDLHNDAGNISHDIYPIAKTDSPGGVWGSVGYPWKEFEPWFYFPPPGVNPHPDIPNVPYIGTGIVQVEVEFALAVSPYDWKASGRWVEDPSDPYGRRFEPFDDFAPGGVPDFDQKQDGWVNPDSGGWSYCGPVAAANSLWWFDSKFELSNTVPPDIADTYPLIEATSVYTDDHDPSNAPILIQDLAALAGTDAVSAGTSITNLYSAIITYTGDLRQGYVITMVNRPDFWWVAEEVERSEDVILLLGFYIPGAAPGTYERVGGHYVTVAGVDKQGGFVAFSDPYWDRMETRLPGSEFSGQPVWTGRVASDGDPPLGPTGLVPTYTHSPLPHTGVYTLHNDAANVSHDVYHVLPTGSPGGVWGPDRYAVDTDIINFEGMNGGGVLPALGVPVQTEVEWAIAVSPVADVEVTKEVTPTEAAPGDTVTFTVQFRNHGSLPAEDVILSDILPTGLVTPTWQYWTSNGLAVTRRAGTTFTWDLPDLAWMEWGVITITAQVDSALEGQGETILTVRSYKLYLPFVLRNY